MAQFRYVALEMSGQQVSGVLTADSDRELLVLLESRHLFPLSVQPASANALSWRPRRVKAPQLAVFYGQLADLLRAGMPLLRCLELLQRTATRAVMKEVIEQMGRRVADGDRLAEAMQAHPDVFPDLAASMVRAGEEGGFLEDALKRLGRVAMHQEDLRNRVGNACLYPFFLVVVGIVIVTAMLVFFVPRFSLVFERLGQRGELPLTTRALLGFSDFLGSYGVLLLVLLASATFAGLRHLHTESGRLWFDHLRLRLYGFGPIIRSLAIARFCRILGTLLNNGIPLLKSLMIAKDATGNQVLVGAISDAAQEVSAGSSLSRPLAASGHFPDELIEMMAVAEEANNLERVLLEIADSLEQQTSQRLDVVVRMLEPVLLIVMAGLILFLLTALLLPIFQTSNIVT